MAVLHHEELATKRARLLTSDYVPDETVTRVRQLGGHLRAVTFLDLIREARRSRALALLRIDADAWDAAEDLFRQRDDQALSFTDCTSFVLLQQNPVDEVFAFDEHFTMFGHNVRPLS